MTKNFEELYNSVPCDIWPGEGMTEEQETADNNYNIARSKKVAEIAEYISDFLKNPDIAESIAQNIMSCAEDMGRISGDIIHGEVPSRYTKDGTPLVLDI